MKQLGLATPEAVRPYLTALSSDFESRSLSDQVIDQVLAEKAERYDTCRKIRETEHLPSPTSEVRSQPDLDEVQHAMGRFVSLWIDFEREIRRLTKADQRTKSWLVPTNKVIEELSLLDRRSLSGIFRIRQLRNNLVHGVEKVPLPELQAASEILQLIVDELKRKAATTAT